MENEPSVDSTYLVTSGRWDRSFGEKASRARAYHLFNYSTQLYPSDLKAFVHVQLCLIYTLGCSGAGSIENPGRIPINKLDGTSKLLCCLQISLNGSLHSPIKRKSTVLLFFYLFV